MAGSFTHLPPITADCPEKVRTTEAHRGQFEGVQGWGRKGAKEGAR